MRHETVGPLTEDLLYKRKEGGRMIELSPQEKHKYLQEQLRDVTSSISKCFEEIKELQKARESIQNQIDEIIPLLPATVVPPKKEPKKRMKRKKTLQDYVLLVLKDKSKLSSIIAEIKRREAKGEIIR